MYVLTTANGREMRFYLESIAKLYRNLYGGRYIFNPDIEHVNDYQPNVGDYV